MEDAIDISVRGYSTGSEAIIEVAGRGTASSPDEVNGREDRQRKKSRRLPSENTHMRILTLTLLIAPLFAQQSSPKISFDANIEFLKYPASMNLGEVLGVAINSKGHIVILNHPGSGTSGPLYGNASTQLFEFDENGKFLREIGHGVYGLGYAHSVRFDKYDNLWWWTRAPCRLCASIRPASSR